jgi:hypothetical protein
MLAMNILTRLKFLFITLSKVLGVTKSEQGEILPKER